MSKLVQDHRVTVAGDEARKAILADIERVAELCRAAMPDAAVEREIRELEALKSAVSDRWPLDDQTKRALDIGTFAAKNIEDWNPMLAGSLMRLDYEVRHEAVSESSAFAQNIAELNVQSSLAT